MREPDERAIRQMISQVEAKEKRRQKQQGKGKPIIAAEFKGYQFVAVGNTVNWGKWKTFQDFLLHYIKITLGEDWGNAELKKPLEERHVILQWYDSICRYQRETIETPGKVSSAPMTGAVSAYLGLAYNLYLLAHNVELRDRLIGRLRNTDQFRGAYYEVFVAGCFILAGFELSLEDEDDSNVSHCEFVATNKASGRSFSVEAKSRAPSKTNWDIGQQLVAALRKAASHERIVLIDVNLADADIQRLPNEIIPAIKRMEESLRIDGNPAPPAFVIVTNHPYHYDPEGTGTSRAVLGEGFKIPDFGYTAEFPSLIEGYKAMQKNRELFDLIKVFREYSIPSTFDDELPEFAFGEAERRFRIGETYDLSEIEPGLSGVLTSGTVSVDSSEVHLAFGLQDGRSVLLRAGLTAAEVAAYRQHPETFFGVEHDQGRGEIKDPLAWFEFFYDSYRNTPKKRLLEFMSNYPDQGRLSAMSQEDLALFYCERMAWSIIDRGKAQETRV